METGGLCYSRPQHHLSLTRHWFLLLRIDLLRTHHRLAIVLGTMARNRGTLLLSYSQIMVLELEYKEWQLLQTSQKAKKVILNLQTQTFFSE